MRQDPLRLVISGGGTAGHVYPALAIVEAWRADGGALPQVVWVGSTDGMEHDIVVAAGLPYTGVAAGALRGRTPRQVLGSLGRLVVGFLQSLRFLRSFAPDVVLTTGGYVCVPVAVAAALLGVPLLVFLPDVKPGLAVRAQRLFATRFALAFDAARPYLPAARTVVTGYPVRAALLTADRQDARARLGLGERLPVLLVYGGSRGARTLNEAVLAALPELLERCQIVHVAGTLDHDEVRRRSATLTGSRASRYHLYDFLGDRLVYALAGADLCVARAGASTLAELPAVGLPAVVVPGPFSDQHLNARYLADRGAAATVTNEEAARGGLVPVVVELLENDRARAAMAAASRRLARPDAAEALIGQLVDLGRVAGRRRLRRRR